MGNISERHLKYNQNQDKEEEQEQIKEEAEQVQPYTGEETPNRHFSNDSKTSRNRGFSSRSKVKNESVVTKSNYAKQVKNHRNLTIQAQQTLSQLSKDKIFQISNTQIYLILQRQSTYQGQFQNKIPHGKGIVHFKNGTYYHGDFKEGDAYGKGLYIFQNGSYYQGEFKNSQFLGEGTMNYLNKGMTYTGTWWCGLPNGKGREQTKEATYIGQFQIGKKSGDGQYIWSDGRRYQGEFKLGVMDGKGIIYDQNGNISYKGRFHKGKKQGQGFLKTSTGIYHGKFHDDYLQVRGTLLFADGKVYEGQFKRSQMNGQGVMYFPSGQIINGSWKDNHNHHIQKIYHHKARANQCIRQIKQKSQKGVSLQIQNPQNEDKQKKQDNDLYE